MVTSIKESLTAGTWLGMCRDDGQADTGQKLVTHKTFPCAIRRPSPICISRPTNLVLLGRLVTALAEAEVAEELGVHALHGRVLALHNLLDAVGMGLSGGVVTCGVRG